MISINTFIYVCLVLLIYIIQELSSIVIQIKEKNISLDIVCLILLIICSIAVVTTQYTKNMYIKVVQLATTMLVIYIQATLTAVSSIFVFKHKTIAITNKTEKISIVKRWTTHQKKKFNRRINNKNKKKHRAREKIKYRKTRENRIFNR